MKRCIAVMACLFLLNTAFSQGLYFRVGGGYSFPIGGTTDVSGQSLNGYQNVTAIYYTPSAPNGILSGNFSNKPASFTAGVQGNVSAGYAITKNIAAQLDANIGIANKKYTYTNDNSISTLYTSPANISYTRQAKNTIILIPSLVLSTGGKTLNLYSRFGVALPVKTKMHETGQYADLTTINNSSIILVVKNSFSPGFAAALGAEYRFNEHFGVFAEASLLALTLYAKEEHIISETVNGAPQTISQPTIQLSKTGTYNNSGTNAPTFSEPYSNVGVNIGVAYRLPHRARPQQK